MRSDEDAFSHRDRTRTAVVVTVLLVVVGFSGAAALVATQFGGRPAGAELVPVASEDQSLQVSVPDGWELVQSREEIGAGGTRYVLELRAPDTPAFVRIEAETAAPGDPIPQVPAALDAAAAALPGCLFDPPEVVADEPERYVEGAAGECSGSRARIVAGAQFTERIKDAWTVAVVTAGGAPDLEDVLASVRLFSHDAEGAAVG